MLCSRILNFALLVTVSGQITQRSFENALSELKTRAEAAINGSAVPGLSIVVVWNGTIQYTAGFGVREFGGNDSVDADTVFQLASVSKPLSATVVSAIITASNGSLTWDNYTNSPTLVAAYSDPWITKELTLADGFSHRSGLYPQAGDDLELLGYDRETILSRLQYMPPAGPFRSSYAYSNYGLTVAAVSASNSVNMSWEQAAKEYLYEPLGMSSTSASYADFLTRTNRATLHVPASDSSGNGNSSGGGNGTSAMRWRPTSLRNPDAQSPAGGVTSNVRDLGKWLQLQLALGVVPNSTDRLISEDVLNDTHTPHAIRGLSPYNTTSYYGLGIGVDYEPDGRVKLSHAGAFDTGARSLVSLDINSGLGIAILSNCFPTGLPEGLADMFFELAVKGETTRDWITYWDERYEELAASFSANPPFAVEPANPSDMLPAEAYVGTYENEYVGVVEVSVGGGDSGRMNATTGSTGLVLSFPGTSNLSFPLVHWDRDSFVLSAVPQLPGQGEPAVFSIGQDGNATSLTLSEFNGNGGGVLLRN